MEPLELLREDPYVLFKEAREMAKNKPTKFASGALIDTYCSSNPPCRHCRWRFLEKFNPGFRRVMPKPEIISRALHAEREGIDWLFMPSGCKGSHLPDYFYDDVRDIKRNSGIELYGLFGTTDRKSLSLLKEAGMDGFRCGIESPNESILKEVRPSDDLHARVRTIRDAKDMGLKVWSGFIVGLGESREDIARGMKLLKELAVDSVSLGWFEPSPFTEMEQNDPPNPFWAAKVMAAMRIYLGDIDMLGHWRNNNPEWGFRAGCNGALAEPNSVELEKLRKMREFINALEEG